MTKLSGNNSRDSFGSKFGIIAATAGSAIGLGNIWRFPYVTGENGGAAFLLVYLGFVLIIGLPVMLSELSIGRATQRNAFGAFKSLRPKSKWYIIGLMGIAAAFMINAFYCVIAGWTLEYFLKAITNQFAGKNPEQIKLMLDEFQLSGWKPVVWTVVFIAISAAVVIAGVEKGIEKYSKILMPLLFALILILDIRAITLPNAKEGLTFLFHPDFTKINGNTILQALGQAFFSLSIGMGALITYGSYIKRKDNLGTSAISVAIADTLIAVLAGIAIFPAVFAFGISPEAGPNLVFITLPNIFVKMTGGYFFSIMFFSLLIVAALTSTISILEVVVAYFTEELKISRTNATLLASVGIGILGVLSSLSLVRVPELSVGAMNLFEILEYTSSNILLPLGGLLIVLFIAWFFGEDKLKRELTSDNLYRAWYYLPFLIIVRFVAPLAIALVFMNGIGLIK